ncbi:MAG: MBG domain-containing protein [bacterium]
MTYAVLSGVGELIGTNGLRASSGTGMIVVQASKAADELYLLQSTVATVTVTKAMASVVLGDLARTYDGSGKAATATSLPTNLLVTLTYNGSDAIPTNAGSYAVTGTVMDVMWQGFQTGLLVIARAQDTITFGATNHVYDGTAKSVTATAESGFSVSLTYAGSPDAPINAGVYAVTGVVDAANWQATNTTWLTITKADQVITNFLPADGVQFVLGSGTTVVATATSGLPVSFSNLTPEVTLMLRNDLTFTHPGLARMRASQVGNSNWNAAVDVIHSWRIGGLITNVTPAAVNVGGRIQVVIQGIALGNGGDITNVTLAGVEATIITQTLESVTVMANAATGAVAGAVTVVSSTGGLMVLSNAFAYLWFEAPELLDPVSITESNLVARWVPPTNAAACELDIGLDTNFTAYLPGYKGLGVALAQHYTVTGLEAAVWYAIRTFAYNTNGYSLPSRTVWVPAGKNTPYETHPPLGGPVSIGAIMEQPLANMFSGQGMEYSVVSSDTNVVVASITADSLLRLEPRSPGKAMITVRATEHGTGYTSTYVFEVEVTGVPTVISNVFRTHERWNPRFEQLLKVSNDSLYDAVGVRLLFTNLMAGIIVENRTGTSWDGRPMIEQSFDFSAGVTQLMSIVYLCTGEYRVDQYPPAIEVQYILTAWHRPFSGVRVNVKAWMMSDGSGRFVLEFPSEPGGLYAVEYVNDLSESDWIQVPLRLKAGANRTQWIDSGPPATLPVKAGKRFYRVKQIEI